MSQTKIWKNFFKDGQGRGQFLIDLQSSTRLTRSFIQFIISMKILTLLLPAELPGQALVLAYAFVPKAGVESPCRGGETIPLVLRATSGVGKAELLSRLCKPGRWPQAHS